MTAMRYVRWFSELGIVDVPLVGGKNASIGEIYRELTAQGVRVPNGFAVTADAFREALTAADAWDELHALLDDLDKTNVQRLAEVGLRCREGRRPRTSRRSRNTSCSSASIRSASPRIPRCRPCCRVLELEQELGRAPRAEPAAAD